MKLSLSMVSQRHNIQKMLSLYSVYKYVHAAITVIVGYHYGPLAISALKLHKTDL